MLSDHQISATKVRMASNCELRYGLSYEDVFQEDRERLEGMGYQFTKKVKKLIMPVMDYNFFGDLMHHMFENFFNSNFKTPDSFRKSGYMNWDLRTEDATRRYGGVLFRNVDKQIVYHMRTGLILPKFFEENIEQKNKPVEAEKKIDMKIARKGFVLVVKGKRELIYKSPDGLVVRDYKTGHHYGDEFDIEKNPQFPIYSYVTEQETGERPLVELYIPGRLHSPEFAKNGERIPPEFLLAADKQPNTIVERHQFTHEDHMRVREIILEGDDRITQIRRKIYSGKRLEPNYGPLCRTCPHSYLGTCDLYTGSNKFSDMGMRAHMEKVASLNFKEGQKKRPKKKSVVKGQLSLKFRQSRTQSYP